MMENFKTEIEAFLDETGMAPTTFGRRAVKDPGFVARMRAGARSWEETQAKCIHFIASERASIKAQPSVSA